MLILAATPIGNLSDCSQRLATCLAEADYIYAEDTRHARKLLKFLDISQRLHPFHDHSPPPVLKQIRRILEAGHSLVYISDAGTPLLNDPGYELVQIALDLDVPIDHVPGPSAPVNALVLSGLPPHEFCFLGFFPTKKAKREALLTRLPNLAMTAIFFEAPSRIRQTLRFLETHLPSTAIALCRELTKMHQEVLRGTPTEVQTKLQVEKGEIVLLIDKVTQVTGPASLETREQMLRESGLKPNQIAKTLAAEFGISKREVYAQLAIKKGDDAS